MTTYLGALQLDKPKVIEWSHPLFEAFIAGAWILRWTDDTLYWIAKPTVHKDPTPNTRRLHNDHHAALESDLENLYFWRGVLVPAFVIVRPDWITVKHITTEENVEVRRVMLERFGWRRFARETNAKQLDADVDASGPRELLRIDLSNDEPLVYVSVTDPAKVRLGLEPMTLLRVPPQMRTCREAVAWTFARDVQQYAPQVET